MAVYRGLERVGNADCWDCLYVRKQTGGSDDDEPIYTFRPDEVARQLRVEERRGLHFGGCYLHKLRVSIHFPIKHDLRCAKCGGEEGGPVG